MSVSRCRVRLRKIHPNASKEEQEKAFKHMHAAFKRQVNESGILSEFKRKQYFESKGEKKRRLRKESELARLKETSAAKIKDYFGN